MNTPLVVQAARCKAEQKLISAIGWDNFKKAQPYLDELICTLSNVEPVTPRRLTLPGEPEPLQPDPYESTLMRWQLDGKTVNVAIAEAIN